MKVLAILLMSLVALTLADDPPKCCTDRQFQAVIGRVGGSVYPLTGNTIFIDGYEEIAYDFYRKRIGAIWHQRLPDGSVKQTNYLVDYVNKRQYIYQDGKCTITPLDSDMVDNCIPANATFLGTSTLGFGAETLAVNTWEYVSNGVTIKSGMTAKGCVPVLVAQYGMINGVATDFVEVISGFKPGIDKPQDLDLPPSTAGCVFVDTSKAPTDAPVVGKRSLGKHL